MNLRTIYRIEFEGNGIFNSGNQIIRQYLFDLPREIKDKKHLAPYEDSKLKDLPSVKPYKFGFSNWNQLVDWFTITDLKFFIGQGAEILAISIPEDMIIDGETQCLIKMDYYDSIRNDSRLVKSVNHKVLNNSLDLYL